MTPAQLLYERERAKGNHEEALRALDSAIDEEDNVYALATLASLREAAAAKVPKPGLFGWKWRVSHGK